MSISITRVSRHEMWLRQTSAVLLSSSRCLCCYAKPANLAVLFNLGGPDAGLLRSYSGWLTQVGWRLASVWLVFGCCRRGLGPRTRPAAAGPRPQPHCSWLAGASGARGCLCAGPTSTMAEGYNATRHWMLHCPVMLVMAVLLTASVASAVGAIRLCASAA